MQSSSPKILSDGKENQKIFKELQSMSRESLKSTKESQKSHEKPNSHFNGITAAY